ncbi:TetR/AcrR family transcriptional regulator [Dietzia timorensis]|uniref:TetR/AcrR family transcriptional regulator n=1 Tax=Dietzia timorensis TaxID=499555 RepID=UPI0008309160|nr:TetR/AcrR family transcriptional regulator [Dietzia timorensis]
MPKVSPDHMELRREQILAGARTCFAEYGFEGATVSRLEAAIELSRGAIFHHFADKDALFLELARRDTESMRDTIAEDGLVQVMRNLLASPEDYSWLGTRLEVARRVRTDNDFRAKWADHQKLIDEAATARLVTQKESGRVRTDVSDKVMFTYLDMVLDGLISHLASGGDVEIAEEVLDLVEQSVRTSE